MFPQQVCGTHVTTAIVWFKDQPRSFRLSNTFWSLNVRVLMLLQLKVAIDQFKNYWESAF